MHGTVSRFERQRVNPEDILTVTVQPAAPKTSTVGRGLYGSLKPYSFSLGYVDGGVTARPNDARDQSACYHARQGT